jgi:hypothetical protein
MASGDGVPRRNPATSRAIRRATAHIGITRPTPVRRIRIVKQRIARVASCIAAFLPCGLRFCNHSLHEERRFHKYQFFNSQTVSLENQSNPSDFHGEERIIPTRTVTSEEIKSLKEQKKQMELLVRTASLGLFLQEQRRLYAGRIVYAIDRSSSLKNPLEELARIDKKLEALNAEIDRDPNVELLKSIMRAAKPDAPLPSPRTWIEQTVGWTENI